MMNVVKPFHLSFNRQVLEHNNQFHFIASITSGIRLSSGEPLLESEFLKDAIENMGAKPLPDAGMPKPFAEYLVSGSYFSPTNEAVTGGEVMVKVGQQQKNLLVFGPRQWVGGLPSKPEPIKSLPIEYSFAYGGKELETNTDGIGYQDEILPNIEIPDQLVTSPKVQIEPAGFSVLDPACSQRRRYLGTYDDNYLQQFFPGYPVDFDWQFFLVAPKDQRIDGFYQGNENFEFHNMHPGNAAIKGQLPDFVSRCFLKHGLPDEHQQFTELKLNVDTLWFFPEIDLALVIWRGGMQVRDDEAEQISDILLAFESPTDPSRNLDYYEAALEKRIHSDDVLLNNFNTKDLIPDSIKCAMQIFQEDALSDDDKSAFSDNLDAKIASVNDLVNEKTDELVDSAKAGMDNMSEVEIEKSLELEKMLKNPAEVEKDADVEALNATLEKLLPGITSGDAKKIDLTKFSFDKIDKIMAAVKELMDKKNDDAMSAVNEATEQVKLQMDKGMEEITEGGMPENVDISETLKLMEQFDAEAEKLVAPLPRMNAKEMAEKLSEFNPDMTEAMQNLQTLKASGADNEVTQDLEKMINESLNNENQEMEEHLKLAEVAFRETYYMGAHHMEAGASPHVDSLEKVAERFILQVSQGKSVAGGDWACIDLSGRVLDNLDLSDCYLEQVDFTGASLRNANLAGAILPRAILSKADFTGANFEGANLGAVKANETNFSDSVIRSAKISNADFTRANFTRCLIEEVESLELILNQADFSEASLLSIKLIDLDIKAAKFNKADFSQAKVLQCSFHDVDFQQATMTGAVWADVIFEDVNFEDANLGKNCFVATEPEKSSLTRVNFSGACLDGVNMQNMNMPGSNLSKASMKGAIFSGACMVSSDLSDADARQAQFRKANMEHCNMTGINLMEGSLAKARLSGATLHDSNLYSVDFLRSVVGDTDLAGSLLENTLLQFWRPS